MEQTIATPKEKQKVFELIKSKNIEFQKYGVDLARSLRLKDIDVLFAIMSQKLEHWKFVSENWGATYFLEFLNIEFVFSVNYYPLTGERDETFTIFIDTKSKNRIIWTESKPIHYKTFCNLTELELRQIHGLIQQIKTI
jgi:hypothetical protein